MPPQVVPTVSENSGGHRVEREAVGCVWGGGAGVAWPGGCSRQALDPSLKARALWLSFGAKLKPVEVKDRLDTCCQL